MPSNTAAALAPIGHAYMILFFSASPATGFCCHHKIGMHIGYETYKLNREMEQFACMTYASRIIHSSHHGHDSHISIKNTHELKIDTVCHSVRVTVEVGQAQADLTSEVDKELDLSASAIWAGFDNNIVQHRGLVRGKQVANIQIKLFRIF